MKSRYMTILITLAFLGLSISALAAKPVCPGDPRCKPDDGGGDPVVYTVALTAGVFEFDAVEAALNSKDHLNSVNAQPLVMYRPGDPREQALWDAVIGNCAGSLAGDPTITEMFVNFDAWGVGKNSDNNIWIDLSGIQLPPHPADAEKQIQIQLRGVPGTRYLPLEGEEEVFVLDFYVIWGKRSKGKKRSWDTCFTSGDGGVEFPNATLKITRPAVSP